MRSLRAILENQKLSTTPANYDPGTHSIPSSLVANVVGIRDAAASSREC